MSTAAPEPSPDLEETPAPKPKALARGRRRRGGGAVAAAVAGGPSVETPEARPDGEEEGRSPVEQQESEAPPAGADRREREIVRGEVVDRREGMAGSGGRRGATADAGAAPGGQRAAVEPKPDVRELVDELAGDVDAGPAHQTSVYVLPNIRQTVRRLRKSEGKFYSSIAMDAVDWALDEGILLGLVRARQMVERPANSRFPSRRGPRRVPSRRGRGGSSRVLWPVQFTHAELEVLDQIMAEVGAESRSEVVSAAVEAYLE